MGVAKEEARGGKEGETSGQVQRDKYKKKTREKKEIKQILESHGKRAKKRQTLRR